MILPRNDYSNQEKCRSITETVLLEENYYIYGWRQVPVNPKVLGEKAEMSRPEITQVLFRKNEHLETDDLERDLFCCQKKNKSLESLNLKSFIFAL